MDPRVAGTRAARGPAGGRFFAATSISVTWVLLAAAPTLAAAPASALRGDVPGQHVDPAPHATITQPYRVCQDLEELTARIDNLYRKPFGMIWRD